MHWCTCHKLIHRRHQILTKIWGNEKMPQEWNLSKICTVFKKGDRSVLKNYREINLLNVAYKIPASIISERELLNGNESRTSPQGNPTRFPLTTSSSIFGRRTTLQIEMSYIEQRTFWVYYQSSSI
uniref:Uncharacterized protein n=1 Tax=Megaselia scalaris TaxID=36166 RepID=T1GS35_MEGSC